MTARIFKGAGRDPNNMSLGDPRELRRRLFICLGTIVIGSHPCVVRLPVAGGLPQRSYCVHAAVAGSRGHHGSTSETNLLDPFTLRLRIAGWGAVILAMPVILWQLWRFIAPGLYKRDGAMRSPSWAPGPLCSHSGAAIAYYTLARRPSS
ncbi:MAG: twin-arginine translocase subunit TatC [Microthrixaceae bacterium]